MRPNVLDAPNHAKEEVSFDIVTAPYWMDGLGWHESFRSHRPSLDEVFEGLGHKQAYWLESANGAG
jgi:hypothetical protein